MGLLLFTFFIIATSGKCILKPLSTYRECNLQINCTQTLEGFKDIESHKCMKKTDTHINLQLQNVNFDDSNLAIFNSLNETVLNNVVLISISNVQFKELPDAIFKMNKLQVFNSNVEVIPNDLTKLLRKGLITSINVNNVQDTIKNNVYMTDDDVSIIVSQIEDKQHNMFNNGTPDESISKNGVLYILMSSFIYFIL